MEDDNSSQMAASGASLTTLPEEMILHIFSFLAADDLMFGVRATCKHFYTLSLSPGLWKRVRVPRIVKLEAEGSCCFQERFYRKLLRQECIRSNGSDTLPVTAVIKSVEERGAIWPSCSVTGTMQYPNLERLTLVRRIPPSVEVLVNHQSLTHLELRTSLILDDENRQNCQGRLVVDLFEKLKGLTELQTLTLHFEYSECTNNSSSISDIQASMKDYFLTSLGLRQIELKCFVNDEILKVILDNCLKLEDLAIISPGIAPEAFCEAVSGQRQLLLSTLRIECYEELNDACLKALSVAFPKIKSLQLSLTREITNDALGLFLGACTQLTDLKLTTFDGHTMLGKKTSKNLQSVALYSINFSSGAFQKLCQYSQNLREIQLFSTDLNSTDMITMTKSCRVLEKVVLWACRHVDSTGVAYIINNLPRLQSFLCLLKCPELFQLEQLFPSRKRTRAGGFVLETQAGPTEGELRSLELLPCQLTAVGVSALAVLCPNLHELVMRTPSCLDDHIVRVILRNLPNLQCLRLTSTSTSRQNQLTRACLRHVQRWGTQLQRLRLITHYRSFTIAALVKLLAQSSTLVECVVPCHTEQNPDIPVSEMLRMANRQAVHLQRQEKRCVVALSHITAVSVDVLCFCVCRR